MGPPEGDVPRTHRDALNAQTFYFDGKGMLTRHDYEVDVAGGASSGPLCVGTDCGVRRSSCPRSTGYFHASRMGSR